MSLFELVFFGELTEGEAEPKPPAAELKRRSHSVLVPKEGGAPHKILFVVGERAKQRVRDGELVPMLVDLPTLDHHWAKDRPDFYIPPGKEGVPGRRANVEKHLTTAKEVDMPYMGDLDDEGALNFVDGRHRIAVLRDKGVTHAPVLVPQERVDRVKRVFKTTHQMLNPSLVS